MQIVLCFLEKNIYVGTCILIWYLQCVGCTHSLMDHLLAVSHLRQQQKIQLNSQPNIPLIHLVWRAHPNVCYKQYAILCIRMYITVMYRISYLECLMRNFIMLTYTQKVIIQLQLKGKVIVNHSSEREILLYSRMSYLLTL